MENRKEKEDSTQGTPRRKEKQIGVDRSEVLHMPG
jgi:hypothetical protein